MPARVTPRRKWRPGLGGVILAMLALVLVLPFAGLNLFRFYANQLVQQTEESLLMQAAVLTSTYEELYRTAADLPPDPLPSDGRRPFRPLFPAVTVNPQTILGPRPDGLPATEPVALPYQRIAPYLSEIALGAQEQTLAGYRFLDRFGTVIAGSAETGVYLGHVQEVALALNGDTVSVPRVRTRPTAEPLIYRFSQGTRVRIFVAMPVTIRDDIIGVVYLNRTPNHIFRFLYTERLNLFGAAMFVLLSTGLIGYLFWRFVSRPIRSLAARTETFGASEARWEPLDHYGTREIEVLAQSFGTMANRLQDQQTTLKTYTAHVSHEMKSPLTAIKGAVELLQDSDMPPERQVKFLENIARDTERMEQLLARMREYSAVGQLASDGTSDLAGALETMAGRFPRLDLSMSGPTRDVPLSPEALEIVFRHLIENAESHGATEVRVAATDDGFSLSDNGSGISAGNRDRIFEPFFTSRRTDGGTGMGLSIVRSVLSQSGGRISLVDAGQGTTFDIQFTT
ncbi:sensor histidine kinase [Gymnodinialimonas hymeniacidonis]|uniref:sensor histidine kinase n=1 Tax=Gymnodinialimonas hymeniacidonis TaxID=3126508 RepID=UPI0034C5ED06